MGVQTVVSDSNPEGSQLPEHNGDDEDHLGHCGWGATVDTIGCSQVRTTEKDEIAPPNSRSPLGRTGGHEREKRRQKVNGPYAKYRRADSESLQQHPSTAALICRYCKPYCHRSATLLTSRIVSSSVNQTFHSFSSLALIPIPTGR